MLRREGINSYWAYWGKLDNNDENAIKFKWLDVQEEDEEDIALANFIWVLEKANR